jgi:hypothetical protein
MNASRGAAPFCRPHEHDLLCVQGTYTSGYGCTASNLVECKPPLSDIDAVRIWSVYDRIPTALCTALWTQEEKAEQHNDRQQLTNNDNNNDDNNYYKNNYNSDNNYNNNKNNDDNKDDDNKDDEDDDKNDKEKDNNKWTKMQRCGSPSQIRVSELSVDPFLSLSHSSL